MSQYTVHIYGYGNVAVDYPTLAQYVRARQVGPEDLVVDNATKLTWQAKNIPGLFSDKDYLTALLLSIFIGGLGVDRFYTGHTGIGVGKLLLFIFSCGTLGWIWAIVDIILFATRQVTDSLGRPLK